VLFRITVENRRQLHSKPPRPGSMSAMAIFQQSSARLRR
jgi:hypothetical protein